VQKPHTEKTKRLPTAKALNDKINALKVKKSGLGEELG